MKFVFSRCVWVGAVFGVLSMFAGFANAQAEIIFSEDFSGTSGAVSSLDGTAEDTSGAIWAANGFATDNGILNTGQFEGSATLATTLAADTIYTLNLDVTSDSDDWVGLGFSENGSTSVANRPQDRFAQSGGRAWFLYRPEEGGANPIADQVQIFGGSNTANGIADIDTDYSGALTTRTLTVILDTASTGFQADFLIDGVSQSSGFQSVGGTLADFAHVGFTFEGPGGAAAGSISVDNFSFSGKAAIPEPSSMALLGLVSVVGLTRRRRS